MHNRNFDMENEGRIFISYRRDASQWQAFSVYFSLTEVHKRTVFMDIESMGSGNFEEMIFNAIENSRHYVLILSNETLDRCADNQDLLRKEIEHAFRKNRNIVPLLFDNFSFEDHDELLKQIQLQNLSKQNGLEITPSIFSECIEKLNRQYLVDHYDILEDENKPTEEIVRYAREVFQTNPDFSESPFVTPSPNKTTYISGTSDFWKLNEHEEYILIEELDDIRKGMFDKMCAYQKLGKPITISRVTDWFRKYGTEIIIEELQKMAQEEIIQFDKDDPTDPTTKITVLKNHY